MKTSLAFLRGQANRGKEMMVFDWVRAARIIKELQPQEASAGLEEDWENTGGRIFVDGKPYTDDYTFLASTWATPQLLLDGKLFDCYAGLEEDWENTGGRIFVDGKPYTDDYTFLASTWATPQLLLDGKLFDCYAMESEVPDWNMYTQWPRIALDILYS